MYHYFNSIPGTELTINPFDTTHSPEGKVWVDHEGKIVHIINLPSYAIQEDELIQNQIQEILLEYSLPLEGFEYFFSAIYGKDERGEGYFFDLELGLNEKPISRFFIHPCHTKEYHELIYNIALEKYEEILGEFEEENLAELLSEKMMELENE